MDNFNESGLSEAVLRAIADLGFTTPTPVQAETLPLILGSDRDLIALARTGTGKTGGFGLPLIDEIDEDVREVQALILCPTRELCLQIARDFETYAKYRKGVKIAAVYGGAHVGEQIRALENGAQVVVGTPGRTLDLINRRKLKVGNIKRLVLDEADEMLNMGFQEELDAILGATPEEKQTLLFSATMPKDALRIAEKYMENPNQISVGHSDAGNSKVVHTYFQVRGSERFRLLKMLVEVEPEMYAVIFCRTRREVDGIANDMRMAGIHADAIHGDLSQAARDDVMGRFRRKQIQLLVATDVAARGLDVQDLTHVINYNLPDQEEVYVHRSGRTGRAGKEGQAFSIISGRESRKLRDIERHTGITFERGVLPTAEEIYQKQVMGYIERVEATDVTDNKLKAILASEVYERFSDLTKEELIDQFVGTALGDLSKRYAKNAPLQDEKPREERGEREDRSSRRDMDYTRLCIRMGKAHGMNPAQLIGMLNRRVPRKRVAIGKVDVQRNLTYFDVDAKEANVVVESLTGVVDKGVSLDVQVYGKGESGANDRGGNDRGGSRGGSDKRKTFKKEFGFKKKAHRKG